MNTTPQANRIHIAFFGVRNAGKSSLVNAVTNQEMSIVSDVKGTTTDPVTKSMEILPIGATTIIDTPGLDDEGILGEKRVQKTKEILAKTDIAILIVDINVGMQAKEIELIGLFKSQNTPFVLVYNKCDMLDIQGQFTQTYVAQANTTDNKKNDKGISFDIEAIMDMENMIDKKISFMSKEVAVPSDVPIVYTSALHRVGIEELKDKIASLHKMLENQTYKPLVSDLIETKDIVVLVTPIDASAPKGRIILPQQQVLRDVLDTHAIPVACQVEELSDVLKNLSKKPKLVITDSQVFKEVEAILPKDMQLTSFSILMARYKGELDVLIKGIEAIKNLKDGDKVLIAEACTHHRQCNDIGTVKMPHWIENFTKVKPIYEISSGNTMPQDLSKYKVVIHCGGCMITSKAMQGRMQSAQLQNVPIVNYGMVIAHMHGILDRAMNVFEI